MIYHGRFGRALTCRGFTFIEMLAVFLLMSLAVGIVYPVGWRLAQKFERRLERAALEKEKKQQEFIRFIKDERRPRAAPGTGEGG